MTRSFSVETDTNFKSKDIKLDDISKITTLSPSTFELPSSSTKLVAEQKPTTEKSTKTSTESEETTQEEEIEEEPLEKRLKQISEEVEKLNNMDTNERDIGRQSFFSLSDLIKTLRPNDKKIPQIDSDYSNTMRVLGETIFEDEGRNLKTEGDLHHTDEVDPTNL